MNPRSHPSKDITGTEGMELADRKIALCITGSVAAYRAIDLARLLMRHGADVYAVMTDSTSTQLLPAEMMKWATGNDVVTKLTGNLEHIQLADYGMSDLVVVYPCTANTIGKAANGIDDTPVTSVLSVALGSKIPVVIAPAMHEAMYDNPVIKQNVETLRRLTTFVGPNIVEGKAKVAEPQDVLDVVIAILSRGPFSGMRVLVTAGSTIEYIDPIRVITNLSSGRMGIALAEEARKLGADITLVYGHGTADPGNSIARIIRVSTGREMQDTVASELASRKYDIAIMAAAVADYAPAKKSEKKIDSRAGKLEIELVKTAKIVDMIKQMSITTTLVAFKADYNVDEDTLVDRAYQKLKESGADIVVANDIGKVAAKAGPDKNEVYVVDRNRKVVHLSLDDKNAIAKKLLEIIGREFGSSSPGPTIPS
jgi:phosphopantothenoylcysteine decarboxylase / phosphopantothenate---cysteine ligase